MPFTLNDFAGVAFHLINESVFIINAAAPPAGEITFQRFRLANAVHLSISGNIFKQVVDAFYAAFILFLPPEIFLMPAH